MRPSSILSAFLAVALAGGAASCVSETRSGQGIPHNLQAFAKRPLGPGEQAVLEARGFVLSTVEPMSFHEGYAALYKAHEPVYFTADALLHALHASFDAILADVEKEVLSRELGTLLKGLRAGLAKDTTAPAQVRADMDTYLAVATSLLDDKSAPPVAGGDAAVIDALVDAAEKATGPTTLSLFGDSHEQDLSMMKPRGHYTRTPELTRYFRAMMWLGTVDIRLADKEQGEWKVHHAAVEATVLLHKLATPKLLLSWQRIDKATEVFVGPRDSMSFPGLGRALGALGYPEVPLSSRSDNEILAALVPEASQKILGSMILAAEHPLAFLLLGQRFVADSLVFSETTYARIPDERLMPSPLDVAAAIFHNPAAEPLLAPELDLYRYRDALHGVAKRTAAMGPSVWEGNIYHGWLRALSKLSPDPVRDKGLPPVFRSEPWQRRMLSSQLASWAELRHDTVLYAKQSFTTMLGCDYPDGYVDPYPEFFAEIDHMAQSTADFVGGLDFGKNTPLKGRIARYFGLLGEVSGRLGKMASLERANQPLGSDDVDYLKGAVAFQVVDQVCTVSYEPEGWHASLYYERDDILKREPVVCDVHTQPTDATGNMVGRVLHVGTGHPRQITIVIETDTGKRTYRGFVGTYHETITENFQRMNDEEWRKKLVTSPPPNPAWLTDLVANSERPRR